MSAEQRLRILEEALQKAQEEIKDLKQEVQEQKAARETEKRETEEKTAKEGGAPREAKKEQVAFNLPAWVNKLTPFGDFRFRFEGFYNQQQKDGALVHARNRERIRARVGLKFTYSDELSTTIRLATGDPNDPISTNETLTGDFSRKHINLDWAFLTFTPGQTFGIRPGVISFTAGKFPNPMFRADEMVFDDDLSVEGTAQQINVLSKPAGPLEQIRLYINQWSVNEVSNSQDAWMIGGQINPVLHAGPVLLEGGVAQYWWLNADQIAQALNTNQPPLINTNLLETTTNSDGDTTITGYKGAFNQTNLTVQATIPDVVPGMPLRLWTDYVHNWQAFEKKERAEGVQAGVKLGNAVKRGDWAVGALYEYLEQEAAISSFVWSDFGNGGTNQQGPVFWLDYQLLDPLTLTARTYVTNYIDTPADTSNSTQFRLQLDAQVKF